MVFIVQRNQRLKLTCILTLFRETYFSGARLGKKNDDRKTSDLTPSTRAPHCAWLLRGSKHSNVWAIERSSFKIRHSHLSHHATKVYSVSISCVGGCVETCTPIRHHQWLGTQAGLVFRKGCTRGVWPTQCGVSKFIGWKVWFLSSSLVFEPARPTT